MLDYAEMGKRRSNVGDALADIITAHVGVVPLLLRYRQEAKAARLSAASAGGDDTAIAALRFRFAPLTANHGLGDDFPQRINADQSVEPGWFRPSQSSSTYWRSICPSVVIIVVPAKWIGRAYGVCSEKLPGS